MSAAVPLEKNLAIRELVGEVLALRALVDALVEAANEREREIERLQMHKAVNQ